MTRDDFMEFFRDSEKLNLLSVEDRIEVFKTILLGSDDLTEDLVNEVLKDYNVSNIIVTKQ